MTTEQVTPSKRRRVRITPKSKKAITDQLLSNEELEAVDETEDYDLDDEQIEAIHENSEEDDEDYGPDIQTVEEIREEVKKREFDIFIDYGEIRAKADDIVKYTIMQNNQLLTSKHHPYSWEELQNDHGGGHYKVVARSGVTGKIIKTQVKQVSSSGNNKNTDEGNGLNTKFLEMIEKMNTNFSEDREKQKLNLEIKEKENFKMLNDMQEKVNQEAKESQNTVMTMILAMMNKPKDNSSNDMMAMMMQMQQQSQQQMLALLPALTPKTDNSSTELMTMMMQMQQQAQTQNMAMIEKLNESNTRSMEKFSDKLENLKKGDGDGDGMKMLDLWQKAQGSGFDQMKMITDLADKKAQELRDSDGGGSDDSDDSLTKTLIKSVVPALSQFASLAQQNKEVAPVAAAPQRPVRQIPPEQRQHTRPNPQTRANGNQHAAKNAQTRENNQSSRNASRQNAPKTELVYRPPRPDSNLKPTIIADVATKPKISKMELEQIKKKAVSSLTPVIIDFMGRGENPQATATASIQKLIADKIDPSLVVQAISVEYLKELASGYGLDETAVPGLGEWLKGYHDSIKEITTPKIG